MDERLGDPSCKHQWVFDALIVLTNPATYHKICKLCGRIEHEREEYPLRTESFEDIMRKFHEDENK